MPRPHSRLLPAELVLAQAQTAKTPLLPTRNALAKAGSPVECAAATVRAHIAADGTPEKPSQLPARNALAKAGSPEECAAVTCKLILLETVLLRGRYCCLRGRHLLREAIVMSASLQLSKRALPLAVVLKHALQCVPG